MALVNTDYSLDAADAKALLGIVLMDAELRRKLLHDGQGGVEGRRCAGFAKARKMARR